MENSSVGRLLGVLVKPVETFRSIAERPTWGAALVFVLLLSVVSTTVLVQKLDRDSFREQMVAQTERQGQPVGEEQLATMEKIGLGAIVGCGTGFVLLLYLAGPALLMLLSNMLGGQIDYRKSLAVFLHGLMPFSVLSLLNVPIALGRGSVDIKELQSGSLAPSSLAVLAPAEASPRLLALLSSVDLFSFWSLALLILGYHLAAKVSKGKAAAVVIGLWAVLILIKVGLAGLQGG